MRARTWVIAALTVVTVMWLPHLHQQISAQSASGVMISEYRFRGPAGANDEFIELFNAGTAPVDITGWTIRASNNTGGNAPRATILASTVLNPGCFYLFTNTSLTGGYSGTVPGNTAYSANPFADEGGVALTTKLAEIVDQVGQAPSGLGYGEGTRLPVFSTNLNRGIERRPGGGDGFVDTDDNFADFREITPGNPQNAQSACLVPQDIAIAVTATPSPAEQGQPLHVFGRVIPGTMPASSDVTVVGDLSMVGGSSVTAFSDNGVTPDLTAGDNIFTAVVNVPLTNPLGPRPITLTARDAQGRSHSDTVPVRVNPPAVMYTPHDIQGGGAVSPIPIGDQATVRGVVTARSANGFYLQTETGAEDGDSTTSEGLFVYLDGPAPAGVPVGNIVHVTGDVAELVPMSDTGSASITALNNVLAIFDFGAGAVPAAADLTSSDVSATGARDQLERFEGMRVHVASLMAISGTGGVRDEVNAASFSDGAFYAVLNSQARPFREPGIEAGYPVLPCAGGACNIPVFDGNPERLRVDSDALENTSAVNVATGAVVNDVTGVLDFSLRTYTILPDATLIASTGMPASAAPAASAGQFTFASLHLDRFYDASGDPSAEVVLTAAAFQHRLGKASGAVRNALGAPDVVGVQDVENLDALTALARAIDADALGAGQAAPHYSAHLFEGSDPDGLDAGVLVKTANGRVTVLSVEQAAGAAQSRPPVVLRARMAAPPAMLPQDVTVIVNQMVSRAGVETDATVRDERRAQAEFLANYVQLRQGSEQVVSLGDYGAFAFNDGHVDTVGTVAGTAAAADQVVLATNTLVTPALVNVSEMTAAFERYSSIANGNAQGLEHVLVSSGLAAQFAGVVRPRINADVADVFRNDASSPLRMADRDPVVAYFAFLADEEAPSFHNVPVDRTVEATSAAGAVVTYTPPSAVDNLDEVVAVTCNPASGSVFNIGNTGVSCSAQDAAGNGNSASFTVSVVDTTAPALTLPANIVDEATSPEGRVVSYSATATDTVSGSVAIDCSPAPGSNFAVGETVATCAAVDAAGNVASGTFTVTITSASAPPLFGHMSGVGAVIEGDQRVWFAFDVKDTANDERGRVMVQLRPAPGRPDSYLSATVAGVQMSDSPDYTPSRSKTGLDTVVFSGVGLWNGETGYRYEISASDRGEPGRGRDTFSVKVFSPAGELVASVSGVLRDGNIQALR